MPREHFLIVPRGERETAGERVEAHHAERVQVGAAVDRQSRHLLGADERGRPAHAAAGIGVRIRGRARDPEIRHEHPVRAPLQEDVLGLDVAMHDAAGVRVGECRRGLREHPHHLRRREPPVAPQTIGERLPFHVRHGVEHEAIRFVHGEHRHDVRMREPGGDARFA